MPSSSKRGRRASRNVISTSSDRITFLWKICPKHVCYKKSDVFSAIDQGLPIGAATGLLAGLVTVVVPGGSGVGTLTGSMLAADIPNSRHAECQGSIEQGMFLILIDGPAERVDEVKEMVLKHHPEAEFERTGARVLDEPRP